MIRGVSGRKECSLVLINMQAVKCLAFAISAVCASSAIPAYLQAGIEKFESDGGLDLARPQLLISLVATGHAGKNIHQHRLQLHGAVFSGDQQNVHSGKGQVIQPLNNLFQLIEDSHKAILAHAKNPVPIRSRILPLLGALGQIKSASETCLEISKHPNPAVASFFTEMHAVLSRALRLQDFIRLSLGQVAEQEIVDSLDCEDNRDFIDAVSRIVKQGYDILTPVDAAALAGSFSRVEFDRIWL